MYLLMNWCGKARNPSPTCVDEETASNLRNYDLESKWYTKETVYSPQVYGSGMTYTKLHVNILNLPMNGVFHKFELKEH